MCPNLSVVEIDATNLLSVTHYHHQMPLNFMTTYTYHHRLKEVDIQFLLKTFDLPRLQKLKDFKLVAYLPHSKVYSLIFFHRVTQTQIKGCHIG